jgi:hypothetical protein
MKLPSITNEQRRVAEYLGVVIDADSQSVAAARIRDAVSTAIGEKPPSPATSRQVEYGESLGLDVSSDSKRVASAKIADALQEQNWQTISRLDLKPGDVVVKVISGEVAGRVVSFEDEHVISSIKPNGRIWFKGGGGKGAWPSQIKEMK